MIKMQVIGNLGKDCVVNAVNGKNVINFTVAHTEKYKDSQGNMQEKTTWVECAYWTDRTAIAPYLVKGTSVYAEGSPEADAYTNKEGQAAATLRMRVQNIQLLGGNKDNQGSNQGNVSNTGMSTAPVVKTASVNAPAPVDDLPF